MSAAPALVPIEAAPQARPLSPSQVNTWLDCRARWYYGHVLRLPDPPSASLALGRAVHHVARHVSQCRAEGEPPTPAEVADYARTVARAELRDAELTPDDDPAAIAGTAAGLATLYAAEIAPAIPATAAHEIEMHGTIGHCHVRGVADVLTADEVIDLKTARSKPAAISAGYDLQLSTYALLAGRTRARLITIARTKTPTWTQHTLELTPARTRYAAAIYDAARAAMDTEEPIPHRGSNLCSRKHCPFWRRCGEDWGGIIA